MGVDGNRVVKARGCEREGGLGGDWFASFLGEERVQYFNANSFLFACWFSEHVLCCFCRFQTCARFVYFFALLDR